MILRSGTSYRIYWYVSFNAIGGKTGYVALDNHNPLHGLDMQTIDKKIQVHGGVTHAANHTAYFKAHTEFWWVGFDCSHADIDAIDEDLLSDSCNLPMNFITASYGTQKRSVDFCEQNCRSMCRQANALEVAEIEKTFV